MLPFMPSKKIAQVIVNKRGKDLDQTAEVEAPSSDLSPELKSAAEDLLAAIQGKSAIGIAQALKAAFEQLDEEPHEEGPHIEEEE